MPKRAEADSLAARAISGATSGAAICSAKKRPPLIGALLGALGASASAYVFSIVRRRTADELDVPHPLIAIAEDAVTSGAGILVLSKLNLESRIAEAEPEA